MVIDGEDDGMAKMMEYIIWMISHSIFLLNDSAFLFNFMERIGRSIKNIFGSHSRISSWGHSIVIVRSCRLRWLEEGNLYF